LNLAFPRALLSNLHQLTQHPRAQARLTQQCQMLQRLIMSSTWMPFNQLQYK
jgi:hypothetical protein